MKYDFELEMSNNNSLSRIIEQINAGTIVLEFGPATGRLTKYLKEKLECKVYLVELDEESGKRALEYGEDLVVGDIEEYEWESRYQDIRFDYVIFADVLEHLRNPEQVLTRVKHLLKENGTILLSVPNLAHNSVMIELLNNRFEYNSTGLLDNTHIHMFTKQSLDNMLQRAGLNVYKRYATYCKPGQNEIVNSMDDVKGINRSYWLTRDYGEVYQFVYAAKNGIEYVEDEVNFLLKDNKNYYMQLFSGKCGVREENSEKRYIQNIYEKQVVFFTNVSHADSIRFDPLNGSCICKIESITAYIGATSHELKIIGTNASYMVGNMLLFDTEDPIIELATPFEQQIDRIEFVLRYIFIDVQLIKELGEGMAKSTKALSFYIADNRAFDEEIRVVSDALKNTEIELERFRCEKEDLVVELERYILENRRLLDEKEKLVNQYEENKRLVKELERLRTEKEALQCAYISKDAYLERLQCSGKGFIKRLRSRLVNRKRE